MSSSSASESDLSVSNASQFTAPDADDELLVLAIAAATAAQFFLNIVTADDGRRPGKPGESAKGKARNRNRGWEAGETRLDLDYFCWAHIDGKPALPSGG
jgi:hypothetical protein